MPLSALLSQQTVAHNCVHAWRCPHGGGRGRLFLSRFRTGLDKQEIGELLSTAQFFCPAGYKMQAPLAFPSPQQVKELECTFGRKLPIIRIILLLGTEQVAGISNPITCISQDSNYWCSRRRGHCSCFSILIVLIYSRFVYIFITQHPFRKSESS